ncbi:MAG: hypothetical protein QGG53_03945 [Planctomycetota bacterium]|jgi:hypothetical protein|nr:hypothetical protein [Planctomycetota bacterium]
MNSEIKDENSNKEKNPEIMSLTPKDPSIYTTRSEPITVGQQRQLFLDDACIEATHGLTRSLHQPKKCGPVLRPDSEAGQISLQCRSVPQWNSEKNLWEWWYWGSWACEPYGKYHSTAVSLTHYATSEDGIHWEKPDLGLYEWKGSKDNNVAIDPDEGHRSLYHIIRDEDEPDAGRRYKGLFGHHDRKLMVSPDGFEWSPVEVANIPSSDESHFFFDETTGNYVALVKRGTVWGRSVFLETSKDFIEWKNHGVVMHADQTDWDNRSRRIRQVVEDERYLSPPLVDEENYIAETYQMAAMPYEGIYIGFVGIFNPAGAIPPPHMNHTGINQVELTMSRNLRNWRRLCDHAVFIGVEPWDGEAYDTQQALLCGRPIIRDDEIWIYYNACRFRGHKELYPEKFWPYFDSTTALSLAKLKRDRFVSLDAADKGELLTRRLFLTGTEIFVNADAASGTLKAELLDAETMQPLTGRSLADCAPVNENGLRCRLAWSSAASESLSEQTPVRLRFELNNASLFSFWAE